MLRRNGASTSSSLSSGWVTRQRVCHFVITTCQQQTRHHFITGPATVTSVRPFIHIHEAYRHDIHLCPESKIVSFDLGLTTTLNQAPTKAASQANTADHKLLSPPQTFWTAARAPKGPLRLQ